jgi:hypothetical protein
MQNGDRHPQNAALSNVLGVDREVCRISRQVHLQNGQSVSKKQALIEQPQVLLNSAGMTITIHVRVTQDSDVIQRARWNDNTLRVSISVFIKCAGSLHAIRPSFAAHADPDVYAGGSQGAMCLRNRS